MHYKFNVLHNIILIDIRIHSLIRLFVYLSIQSFVRPSVLHSFLPFFLPSFIQPPTNYPKNLLLTDQHTLTVSYVTHQLTANFLSSLRYLIEDTYGWRNGAKFTKFICIHLQCSYCYSRIHLFTFNNRIYILEIYLFIFTCVFLIHDYIHSHSRSKYPFNISAHHLCASVSIKQGLRTTHYGLRTGLNTDSGMKGGLSIMDGV